MKYKVGDKVRIKSRDKLIAICGSNKDMLKYAGKEAAIKTKHQYYYEIDIDRKSWGWTDEMIEGLATEEPAEPTLFDRIKSAIIEAGKQAPIIIEQTEDGGVKISPIEEKEEDLPINTLVMVCSDVNRKIDVTYFNLRRYAGKGYIYALGESASNCIGTPIKIDIIIPFDKFNPNNIEESLKYNIVK